MSANVEYISLLTNVLDGYFHSPRGLGTRELIGYTTTVNMQYPLVTWIERKLNYKFMVAEALWILEGRNDLESVGQYCKKYHEYSDDGMTLTGAYGPPFVEQVRYVVDALKKDNQSRQAVMTMWRQNPRDSKNIPCTIALQFMLRDELLHTNVFMRSSDAWLGWPYDVFCFTMMTLHVSLCLNGQDLGNLTIFAGSQHIYEENMARAIVVRDCDENRMNIPMITHGLIYPDDIKNNLRHILACSHNTIKHQFFKYLWELVNH